MSSTRAERLICLLGHPVAHSKSPLIHNTAFAALDLPFHYMVYDITESEIREAVSAMKLLGVRGFNLTMPLKTAILPCLDEISKSAALSGAVNTVVCDDGRLTGYNTDGRGCLEAISQAGQPVSGEVLCVTGSGGAARAVIAQAALEGASRIFLIHRRNARWEEASAFADKVSEACGCPVEPVDSEDESGLAAALSASSVLIQATNVGMGDDPRSLLPASLLHPQLFVCDIIYHPKKTRLLADAEAAGCRVLNGEGMLLYQAAWAFRLWTGQRMPLAPVREALFGESS